MITTREVQIYLSRAYYLSQRVRSYQEEIAMLRAKAMKQTSSWSEAPSGIHSNNSPQAQYIEQLLQKQDKLYSIASDLLRMEDDARQLIGMLKDQRAKAILEDYHIFRLSMKKLTIKYDYSDAQIYRIRKHAYSDLAKIASEDPEIEDKIRRSKDDG